MTDFEKLGVFYLGRTYDPEAKKTTEEPLLYDAKDLTTHAVCVGMTGSGKTGLGIGLIEEAAIDGIPSIVIDPKGDMGNLLLAFPDLAAGDFRPWVDEGEAARKQMGPDEFAAKTAESWAKGLASWGQDGARIARLKAAADFAIYTPGSRAGLPLSILSSLDAPPPGFADDTGALRDRVSAAVSGLLALVGVEADPLQSREHILLSNVVDREWRAGNNLDLMSVIHAVQEPGLDRIGVLPLESFFPAKERFALAMRLNNLAASPGFSAWTEGEPLDVQRLLYTPEGRPRVSILSISHLSDAERMFFVTVLLNEVLAWTRRQTGTSSLRALLYMDEIFGYFPPTANPPSKTPMLTLLKQARAFGLGIVLATQNPVDLDYRGLSNTGTWFIGRLQTERDKLRVIEGLTSAAAGEGLDRAELDRLMANLGSRIFLMRNVHDDAPVLLESRWCMSYLRGPLSPAQMGTLMADRKSAAVPAAAAPRAAPSSAAAAKTVLPSSIAQIYLRAPHLPAGAAVTYRPALFASARIHFVDLKQKLDAWQTVRHLVLPDPAGGNLLWTETRPAPEGEGREPLPGAAHEGVPADLAGARRYAQHEKDYKAFLSEAFTLELASLPAHKLVARPGESEGDFRIRAGQLLREKRDGEIDKLRKKYAAKLDGLAERERRAAAKVENEKAQLSRQRMGTMVSFGAAALSVLLGRRAGGMGRAATGIGSMARSGKEKLDVQQAGETLETVRRQRAELESEAEREVARAAQAYDPAGLSLATVRVEPRRTDTAIQQMALAWIPCVPDSFGALRPAIEI
ncbi:MAG: ATP-binding protein [Kiritimatiellia bacterium]